MDLLIQASVGQTHSGHHSAMELGTVARGLYLRAVEIKAVTDQAAADYTATQENSHHSTRSRFALLDKLAYGWKCTDLLGPRFVEGNKTRTAER